jgi:hypothetical protein
VSLLAKDPTKIVAAAILIFVRNRMVDTPVKSYADVTRFTFFLGIPTQVSRC